MSEYTEQAEKFLRDTGTKMHFEFLFHGPHFAGEKESRDVYRVTIERGDKSMSVDFGQSLSSSGLKPVKGRSYVSTRVAPAAYDVLSCLQKWEPESDVWEFANEYGYEVNSRESYNMVDSIHMAVIREYKDVCRVFGDVLEQLCEIQ